MEPKLYVGNMSPETSEQDLRTLFSEAGSVSAIDIIMDRYSGQPKGFAFVTMGSQAEAEKAVSLFDTKEMKGSALKVNLARPREERPSNGGYRSRR